MEILKSGTQTRGDERKKRKEYLGRTRTLIKTKLCCRNFIKEIKTWAVSQVNIQNQSRNGLENKFSEWSRGQNKFTMHNALHPEDNIGYTCPEKKEEYVSPDWTIEWIHQFKNCVLKCKERLFAASRNISCSIKINRPKVTRKQRWE